MSDRTIHARTAVGTLVVKLAGNPHVEVYSVPTSREGEDLMCSACIPKIKATAEKLGISEDEVSSILYEHTDFPFGSMEETWQQADEYVAARLRSADA